MGDISHVLTAFYHEPLAILPAKLVEISAFLQARAAGQRVDEKDIDRIQEHKRSREAALFATIQAIDVHAARRGDGTIMSGRVAVMPVFGVLSQRVGGLERSSGGISTEELGSTLDGLVSDKQVKAICMVYDSPGGSVGGVKELGDKIRAGRDQKRIVGCADPCAASAALWLISQSSEVWVSESGQIGSHGVITAHEDHSAMLEKLGVKTTLIASSPHKAEASPYGPLSAEAMAELQSKVQHYHAMFTAALSAGRGLTENKIEKTFGGGRMLTPEQAKAVGMADKIGNLSDVVRRLGGEFNGSASIAAALEKTGPELVAESNALLQELADEKKPKVLPRGAAAARARSLEISGR